MTAPLFSLVIAAVLAAVLAAACSHPALAQEPNPVLRPSDYDVCFVGYAASEFASEEVAWKEAVAQLAAGLDGDFVIEDELGEYYKFESRANRRAFLDAVEGDASSGVGSDLFEDFVLTAALVQGGGSVHANVVPPNDAHFAQQDSFGPSGGLHNIVAAWALLPEGLPVTTVAVIDTGIIGGNFQGSFSGHEDLLGRVLSGGVDCQVGWTLLRTTTLSTTQVMEPKCLGSLPLNPATTRALRAAAQSLWPREKCFRFCQ